MSKTVKEIIKNQQFSSEYEPDPEFLLELRNKITKISIDEEMEKRTVMNLPWKKLAFAFSTFVLIVAFVAILIVPDLKPGMSIAYAMDNIQQTYDELISPKGILHQKVVMTNYSTDEVITYESWDDMSSNMFRNIATYPNDVTYQLDDLKQFRSYTGYDNTLVVETYLYDGDPIPINSGERVLETLSSYEELLGMNESDLILTEETIEGNEYIVIQNRTDEEVDQTLELKSETDVNRYYFDPDTFILKMERRYLVTDSGEKIDYQYETEVLESLPSTNELVSELFTFDFEIPEDAILIEKEIYVDSEGYIYIPEPSDEEEREGTNYDVNEDLYENDQFSLTIPEGWRVITPDVSDDGIVIGKNEYYIGINSNVLITGGGFGYPFEQICPENQNRITKNLESFVLLERVDIIISLNVADGCTREQLGISDAQVSPFWGGSIVKLQGSDVPLLSRSELFDGETSSDLNDLIKIEYGYEFYKESINISYPSTSDTELDNMIKEMDEIVGSIEFKK